MAGGGPPAGYEEVPAPSNAPALGGPPAGYEEVAAPSWGERPSILDPWAQAHPMAAGMLKSFDIGNVASNLYQGAKTAVTGAGSLATDLASNPNWVIGPNSTYEKFVGAPAEAQARQASELWQQGGIGNRVQAAGHELAGALPIVGPFAAQLGEQAGTGDIGGAVGQGLGAELGAEGTAKAVGAVPGAVKGAVETVKGGIPSFSRQAQHFDAFEAAYGDQPGKLANSLPAAQAAAKRMTENKAMAVPGPVQSILDKAAGGKQELIAGMPADEFKRRAPEAYQKMVDSGAVTPQQPMTILQLRHLKTDLGNLISARDIPNTYKEPLVKLNKAVHQDILDSLPTQTAKNWYEATNKEASRAYAAQRAAEKVAPLAGGLAGYYGGRLIGAPLGGELALGAIGHQVGKRVVGGMVDTVLNRKVNAKIPRGAIPPPPGG